MTSPLLRRWMGRVALLALAATLGSACFDAAGDCVRTVSCPPPEPAATQPQACDGTCVPGDVAEGWSAQPDLVWMNDGVPEQCPAQAPNDVFEGPALPEGPLCGTCSCSRPTGTCQLPSAAWASSFACPNPGTTAFDPPAAWDGSCTQHDAVVAGMASVTFAPLTIKEDPCVPQLVVPHDLPKAWARAHSCGGTANGVCPNSGDVCRPKLPPDPLPLPGQPPHGTWTYCISQSGTADDVGPCPSAYPKQRVFVANYTDTRVCSPCTCGPPEGSSCTSTISVYSDGACTTEIGTLTPNMPGLLCLDLPSGGSPLGSKAATPPAYSPGSCEPSGGTTGTLTIDAPVAAFCCSK